MDKDNSKIEKNVESAKNAVKNLLNDIYSSDADKANKLSFWIKKYVKYRRNESSFVPGNLKKYKRGDVIKVDFGFRIGAELGGLHYCIVLNNINSKFDPLITVLPLISMKEHIDINNLSKDRLYLGSELKDAITNKCNSEIETLQSLVDVIQERFYNGNADENELKREISYAKKRIQAYDDMIKEMSKMKHGSIALLGQITSVSKMRIQDPLNQYGVLNKIRISNNTLDTINGRLVELYIHT